MAQVPIPDELNNLKKNRKGNCLEELVLWEKQNLCYPN